MPSPPSSMPSPTPSTSSSSHPHTFSSLSMPPPAGQYRAPSAASAASGRESKASGFLSNGSAGPIDESLPNGYHHHEHSQQTPQPQHQNGGFPPNPTHHSFLPPVTSSPPPHVPAYVPPPQHAMAPDPIHTMLNQSGSAGPNGMSSPTSGWPSAQSGWRGGATQSGFQPPGHQYGRQLPNGHMPGAGMQHQLPPNPLEGYPSRGSLPPLGLNGRPGSRQGESRERRRDREGREDRDGDEEITTIFVVGFPDDMLEREFQNIFTFASGFEAATLKFPSGANRTREPAAVLLAELQQLAASQAGELGEHGIPPPLEEAIAALQISTASSSSTTPSAAISMTPSAPTGPVLGNQPYGSQSTRRQTIGFARFKTRADALAAREHLQSRKIDTLTGATLKAEMAKKNLHTKRTTSGEELVGLLLRSGRLAGLMGNAGVPGGPLNSINGMAGLQQQQLNPQPANYPPPPPHAPQSAREAWDSWPHQQLSDDPRSLGQQYPPPSASVPHSYNGPDAPIQQSGNNAMSSASTSPPLSVTSPNTRPTDSKALLALAEEADEMEGWSVGGAVGMGFDGYTPRRANQSQPQPINQLSQSQGMGRDREVFGSSPPASSDHMSDAGRSMGGLISGANPADQNPPINTLYVGNLPAISPPTLPPNFLEESLRVLFQTCPGYKRMSFRQKINGPMCFVEFEEVGFAANAIQTLYGHSLNGLVKGGIRLSYSKNSLGQRGANHPIGGGGPGFGGIAHTVAMAGMSPNTYNASIPSAPLNGGFGLQLNAHGQSAPAGPVTAPMPTGQQPQHPNTLPGAGTSLSPNAQPFALPSTSPRTRYFGGSASSAMPAPVPVPNAKSDSSYQAFQNASTSPSTASGQFSPVRTPASFSWVSSGSGVTGNGGFVLGSLDGAASAWGSTPSSGGNTGIGQNA